MFLKAKCLAFDLAGFLTVNQIRRLYLVDLDFFL